MKKFYIDVGVVTDNEAHPNAKIGDTEYRFTDDMDSPSFSYDYVSLEKGIEENSPAVFIWVPKVRKNLRRTMQMNAELPQRQRDVLILKGMI